MKRCVVYLIGLTGLVSCTKTIKTADTVTRVVASDATANDVVETASPVWTSVHMDVNANVEGFWQGVPARYTMTTKKYPLIVFIHGIGELGTNLSGANCCGLPWHLYNKTFPANFLVGGVNYSFIVIAPQFKVRPTAVQVQSVIDFAKRRWRIDASRIYVTGMSMGGGSTWDWSAVYGQQSAAIVPVCAGTKPTIDMASDIADKDLPVWGLYSIADNLVPEQWGKDFFSWIDARNPGFAVKTKLTIWAGATHEETWARAYNPAMETDGYNIYVWMLLHRRVSTNEPPVARAGGDRSIYLSEGINRVTLDGTSSTDADGSVMSYKWSKLSGPDADLFVFGTGKTYAAHLTRGVYTFRLSVTDNDGATDTDDLKVVVN